MAHWCVGRTIWWTVAAADAAADAVIGGDGDAAVRLPLVE